MSDLFGEPKAALSAQRSFDVSQANVRFVELSEIKTHNSEIPFGAYGKPHRETWVDFLGSLARHDRLLPSCLMPSI